MELKCVVPSPVKQPRTHREVGAGTEGLYFSLTQPRTNWRAGSSDSLIQAHTRFDERQAKQVLGAVLVVHQEAIDQLHS